ncbi:MAG TPA: DUF1800 domain-containing protein [Steroidobacteraceae bacterium]|nr:DUF1800 domain-containing protein [Steroidobacteraceae bacterium]
MTLDAVTAANRLGLGARPGELDRVRDDPRGWLKQQITGSRPLPPEIARLPSSAEIFTSYSELRRERNDAKSDGEAAKRLLGGLRAKLVPYYLDQVAARYRVAVQTEESFRERLVHFWTNHFAVSADKPQVLALAGALENEAIRPHVAGRFMDMLTAVEAHPAMILYLDNQASIGPDSQLAQRRGRRAPSNDRKLGINENLAREILELHTLGVDGGYTQQDVTTFARALTGWSIGTDRFRNGGEPGKFAFHDIAHEAGTKTILGTRYSQSGVAQPRAVLADLARHPATARHIASKLARHFIADEPAPDAVERIAKAFLDSSGDLPTVHRAVLDTPAAWAVPATKFKTPHELVVSTFRALDYVPAEARQVAAPFELLGQRPYTPGSPAGWPDTATQWDGPDALLKRIEWAGSVAARVASREQPLSLGERSLGAALNERTRVAITRAASAEQGITLLLASPEFQRR